jgi:hypothetical protein
MSNETEGDMDVTGELEELAEHYDDKHSILDTFTKEDAPNCQGYIIIWVDEFGRVSHTRWNMRPWQVHGAMKDVSFYLSAKQHIEMEQDNA